MDPAALRIETVRKLDLQPGDVIHVSVGGDLEDGAGHKVTWVPSPEELAHCALLWDQFLPDDVRAIVTNHLVEETIIQSHIRVGSWPPKVKKHAP